MKIIVTVEEVRSIVEKSLRDSGLTLKDNSGTMVSHIEGQYDDSTQVVDGFSFELMDKEVTK